MDILESPYLRINKFLLMCLGIWPYQKTLHKRIIRTAYACVIISMAVPETLRLIDVWGEMDYVIDCISIYGVQLTPSIKFLNYVINADKIEKLMFRMQNDWKSKAFQPHLDTFEKYMTEGKKLTEIYTVYMYGTLVSYVVMPLMPKILDVIMPLNESRPVVYPLPVKYGNLNAEKYYFPIYMHANTSVVLVVTSIIAMDTTYVIYVQHACGIFTALGDRLRNLTVWDSREVHDEVLERQQEERTYHSIVECVKMHKEAIDFANAIESCHAVVLFFVICLSVFCMSLAGFQTVMNFDQPNEAVRLAIFALALVTHIFFLSWPGQRLIDHSESIFNCVYEARWYEVSYRSRKLLMLMMLRSIEPCKLTAGKFYVMSLSNFSMVMRTSMSYFTVLTSFR